MSDGARCGVFYFVRHVVSAATAAAVVAYGLRPYGSNVTIGENPAANKMLLGTFGRRRHRQHSRQHSRSTLAVSRGCRFDVNVNAMR